MRSGKLTSPRRVAWHLCHDFFIRQETMSKKGITLIELVISSTIAAVLGVSIYSFVAFSGDATRETKYLQSLQQVSAIISEVFQRSVHNGQFIATGNDTVPCTINGNVSLLSVYVSKDTAVQFQISGNSFIKRTKVKGAVISKDSINPFMVNINTDSSTFTVYNDGVRADLTYALYLTTTDGKKYTTTRAVRRARCKNWIAKVNNTPPSDLNKVASVYVGGRNDTDTEGTWVYGGTPPPYTPPPEGDLIK